jgi:hypothetical protein
VDLLDGLFTIADCLSFETDGSAAIILANCASHCSISSALSFDHRRSWSAIVAGLNRFRA